MDEDAPARPAQCAIYAVLPNGTLPPAPDSMAGIWPIVGALLERQRGLNADEEAVQAQQRDMIRDGCFLMESPYPGRSYDVCTRSWFHEYQFYYEFRSWEDHRYFWITGPVGRGYVLDTIWFPGQGVAVTHYQSSVDLAQLERFQQQLRNSIPKPMWDAPAEALPRVAVVGFQHLMHVMWNELPALDRLVEMALPTSFGIVVHCEPFGPTQSLFPELAPAMRAVRYQDMPGENARNSMVIGLGSWTITRSAQARVIRVAAEQAQPETTAQRDIFKGSHHPVFWLSVKPPKRTMSDQAEILAAVIEALRKDYPAAGFILDGASLPWDFPANVNYPPWFHAMSNNAITRSAAIIEDLLARLAPPLLEHVVQLNNISACDEVVWGGAADFYICHGGTMQNKIGWVHHVPGFIHSNRTFLQAHRSMPAPVAHGPPCFYASDALIIDDDPADYSPLELERKDQNYSFTSSAVLIAEISTALADAGLT